MPAGSRPALASPTGAPPTATDEAPIAADYPPPPPAGEPAEPAFAPPDPADRVVGLPAAAALIVGGIVLAIIAVGAIISLTQDRPLTGPAVAPPPPTEAPPFIRYDATTRAAGVEELRVVLPAPPLACGTPLPVTGLFDSAVICEVTVHADYLDKNDWAASSGIGLLEADRDAQPDLRELLAAAASDLLKRNYDVDQVSIKKVKNQPSTVAPAGRARVVTAELHVSYPGLPTDYDAMRVTVVRLAGGRHVVWWGLVPNDSPQAVRTAVAASAESLSAR